MSDIIDDYLIDLPENKKIDYLTIHQFIIECSDLIQVEKKFNFPFYTYFGLLLYINFDKKVKIFYIGFCNGYLINDSSQILNHGDTKQIRKWYYKNEELLESHSYLLKDLILQSMQINRSKGKYK
ncbi:MAG: hypothetical protein ACKOXF_02535 [Chitinophagaceae bacterium]